MRQISNTHLAKVIEEMKNLSSFQTFLNKRKHALERFISTPSFNYTVYSANVGEKKKKQTHKKDIVIDSNPYNLLDKLHQEFENIVTCDSVKLIEYQKEFKKYEPLGLTEPELQGFAKKIVSLLGYSELRSGDENLIFEFYKKLGVKVCVYCNSQHVILLQKSKLARLQADHNLPKMKYPWFAISLANLYPSCNNCNHLKNEDDLNFNLYYETKPNLKIKFNIPVRNVADFYADTIKEENLSIKFEQADTKLDDVLNINEIYKNHNDYAADLMRKHKAYSDEYLSMLQKSFNSLFGENTSQFNRMIFGSSLNESDINQRTFSKLLFDLNAQLILLKRTK